ncbi:MAG: ABC transporter permease [Synechococcales cyanobacterium T60_A2020_003]|nr:ABC transporter permease [Synechococcales cyanobacterium T60_A2020_003]
MSASTPTSESAPQPRLKSRWYQGLTKLVEPTILLGPAGAWLILLLVIPTLLILNISFIPGLRPGVTPGAYGLGNYLQVFDPVYLRVIGRSLYFALGATILCLLLGFPVAYWIAILAPRRWQNILLVAFILPLWTSSLLRAYAWITILRPSGVLPSFLNSLGLTQLINALLGIIGMPEVQNWLNTTIAVLIGMSYSFLPYMVLILYASLEKLDRRLLEAAADLGANPRTVFWKVTVPQTLPGIAAGSLLVFITSLGDFVVPELLGGASSMTVSRLIYNQFLKVRNWGFGSALSMLLILAVSISIALLLKYGDRQSPEV